MSALTDWLAVMAVVQSFHSWPLTLDPIATPTLDEERNGMAISAMTNPKNQPLSAQVRRFAAVFGMWPRLRLAWLNFWGWMANLAGWPCVVRPVEYSSGLGVSVKVRTSNLFTVVTVNGVDVFFYRLSGGIDGVGFSPTSDCTSDQAGESVRSVAPRASGH